jgi:hypothetical protein
MTQGKRSRRHRRGKPAAPPAAADDAQTTPDPTGPGGLPLPSPVASTNLVIADIVFRAAGGMLRERMEKGLLSKSYDAAKAESLVDGRGLATTAALWGASRLARRSPLGLAVVAGGLAAKVFYDRGKRLEAKRRAKKQTTPES